MNELPGKVRSHDGEFYIPSLDGLRALACMIVFAGHAVPYHLSRVVPAAFGVTIFFFLSGYLITTLLRREFQRFGSVNLKHFYLRRALRILPPAYLVLAITVALTSLGILSGRAESSTIVAYLLHFANYWQIWFGLDRIPGGTSVYWSLSVEEHFYTLFPLLFILLARIRVTGRQMFLVILLLCAAVMAWRGYLVTQGADYERLLRGTDTRIDSILFGCALAVYQNPMLDAPAQQGRRWLTVGLPLGLGLLLITFVIRQPLFYGTFRHTLQGLALIPIFVCAIRYPHLPPFRLLNLRIARYIGLISYTLYLSHRPILDYLTRSVDIGWVPRMVLALTLSVAFSHLVYVLVEAPCARLRRRLTAQPTKPTQAVPEVAPRPV